MKIQSARIPAFCCILAVCMSNAPVILGQVPQPQPPVNDINIGDFAWPTPQTQNKARTVNPAPLTPDKQARLEQAGTAAHAAALSLHAGHYSQAEAEARQALSLNPYDGVPAKVLAAALDAQGKEQEALQAYHAMVIDSKGGLGGQTRDLLPYALLLLKSGQWAKAVAVYNRAISSLPSVGDHREIPIVQDGDVIRANSHFSPNVPEPAALATAIHIARGLVYNASSDWAGEPQNTEALAEYGKAMQLAPDSPLANYYYGVGWQQLSQAERAKAGGAQRAKAAFQQAATYGEGNIKKNAEQALTGFK